jgi:outer membrane protein OmpA-like peptidoglycan-associated protein
MQRPLLIIILLLITCLGAVAQSQTYPVQGRIHDFYTALGLKASIYAVVDGQRQQVGEAKDIGRFEPQTGTFRVDVPMQATQLILEMPGYRTVIIPVTYADNVPTNEPFNIHYLGDMTPLDSLPKPDELYEKHSQFIAAHILPPDSLRADWLTYKLTNLATGKSQSISTSARGYTPGYKGVHHLPVQAQPGEYVAVLTSGKGSVLSVETVVVGQGVTFKTIRLQNPNIVTNNVSWQSNQPVIQKDTVAEVPPVVVGNVPSPAITSPSATTLYFDQSSYDLRTQTRHTLDSLTGVLTARPTLRATITGYTDNVGQRTPNIALAEYRARIVATYLARRGISPERLTAQGKGPTPLTDTTEATKRQSRRVEVELRPAAGTE